MWSARLALGAIIGSLVPWLAVTVPAHALACTASITDLAFGNVDTLAGTLVDSTATVSISCTAIGATGVRVCPYLGNGSGGRDATSRKMQGPTTTLRYQLYTDAGHTSVWGSATLGFGTYPTVDFSGNIFGTGTGSTTLTVYGRVPAGQNPAPAGLYTSSFTAADTEFQYGVNLLGLLSCANTQILGATLTPTFTVTANIEKNCLVGVSNVNFGSHGVLAAGMPATGTVSVQCTPATTYSVALDNGVTGSAATARRMTKSSEWVTYGLYKDSAHLVPWGSTGGDAVAATGSGAATMFNVYGLVPPQPTPSPGLYQDTVIATVTY